MKDTSEYGRYYYCIRMANKKDIYAFADEVNVFAGALVLLEVKENERPSVNITIPAGKWTMVYKASVIDGSPVSIEHFEVDSPP